MKIAIALAGGYLMLCGLFWLGYLVFSPDMENERKWIDRAAFRIKATFFQIIAIALVFAVGPLIIIYKWATERDGTAP